MSTNKENKISKATAALLGMSVAVGLGWTLGSGLKDTPSTLTTSNSPVHLALPYRGVCSALTISHENRVLPVQADIRGGLARLSVPLEPGSHDLEITFQGLIPGLERTYPLQVVVDQTPPQLQVSMADPGSLLTVEENASLHGVAEVGSTVFVEGVEVAVDSSGGFQHTVSLEPGWNHVFVRAVDTAANETLRRCSIFRDTEEPVIDWQTKPDEVFPKKQARLVVDLTDDGEVAALSGQVDGEQSIRWFAKGQGRWVGLTPELSEGFHQVDIKAVDGCGKATRSKRQVIIDSSEALGEAVLGLGARGDDVRLLHERLAEAGYLKAEKFGTVFDKETEEALKKLQEEEGFEVTGRAEGKTLIALGPRILINLAQFSLVLDRPGKEQKRWMIASGSYDHPTPVGDFVIHEKVPYPTWLPPKSDWAKDAEPIPPGPNNPLGTRWLGFDWGGVGIHGTNAPWTVGSAASHGCLRMVTSEVEELFELVEVGTPVIVLGGWEEDTRLERYWPDKKETGNDKVAGL